jgi:hypothetical protein
MLDAIFFSGQILSLSALICGGLLCLKYSVLGTGASRALGQPKPYLFDSLSGFTPQAASL